MKVLLHNQRISAEIYFLLLCIIRFLKEKLKIEKIIIEEQNRKKKDFAIKAQQARDQTAKQAGLKAKFKIVLAE